MTAPDHDPPTTDATRQDAKLARRLRSAAVMIAELGAEPTIWTDLSRGSLVTLLTAAADAVDPTALPPTTDRLEPMPRRDHPTPPPQVMDAYLAEQQRLRRHLRAATDAFAAASLEATLRRADAAAMTGDPRSILDALDAMRAEPPATRTTPR